MKSSEAVKTRESMIPATVNVPPTIANTWKKSKERGMKKEKRHHGLYIANVVSKKECCLTYSLVVSQSESVNIS